DHAAARLDASLVPSSPSDFVVMRHPFVRMQPGVKSARLPKLPGFLLLRWLLPLTARLSMQTVACAAAAKRFLVERFAVRSHGFLAVRLWRPAGCANHEFPHAVFLQLL